MKLHLFSQLKRLPYLLTFMGVAFVVFDINYYLMATLPGSRDEMCVMGVNLTSGNILFSLVMSLLTGLFVAGIIALIVLRTAQNNVGVVSVSGFGVGVGTLTMFCPICAIPIFSTGAFAAFFQLFNDYNWEFKLLAFGFLALALVLLNKKLDPDCEECVYVPEKLRKKR